jgi:hypothetical protein
MSTVISSLVETEMPLIDWIDPLLRNLANGSILGFEATRLIDDFLEKSGEPGGNRTHNPQIKSRIQPAKTLEFLRILHYRCANRAHPKQIDATPAQPLFSTRWRTCSWIFGREPRP